MFTQTELAYLYSACQAAGCLSRENGHENQAYKFYDLSQRIATYLEKEDEENEEE